MTPHLYTYTISLAPIVQFSPVECFWFLDRNFADCLHKVNGTSVRKAFCIKGTKELLEVRLCQNGLQVSSLLKNIPAQYFHNFVFEWFDLQRDISSFYQLLSQEPAFNFMPQAYFGLRLMAIPDTYQALCWAVIGQQINLTFAYNLKRQLCQNFGQTIHFEDYTHYIFPTAQVVAGLSAQQLRPLQFSQKKAEYLIEIAQNFENGTINKEILEKMPTAQAQKLLCSIRGVGEWTANYTLMKSLQRLECITHGDAGIYQALHKLKGLPKKPDRTQIQAVFDQFPKWEAYLTLYLWRSLVPFDKN
jgi:DNA-3-methyladenine glycosylase II